MDGFVSRSAHNVTIRIGCPAKVVGGLFTGFRLCRRRSKMHSLDVVAETKRLLGTRPSHERQSGGKANLRFELPGDAF